MKVVNPVDVSNLFNKVTDTSDDITEGTTNKFYPASDKAKVADLPAAGNCYLEIPKADTAPSVGEEGEMYYNTSENAFYRSDGTNWIKCRFAAVDVT